MKVDQIVKNAKIFTSDENNLHATALAVKDGKFVYVGDDEKVFSIDSGDEYTTL